MRLLLDTHIFLWCLNNDKHLTKVARKIIIDADEVYVSSASIWEVAIKIKLKKLNANLEHIEAAIDKSGFIELPISIKHTIATAQLPDIHRDPFDRMLLAQAMNEPLRLLTSDPILEKYSKLVILA